MHDNLYLLQKLQELVMEGPIPPKKLAEAIGKPYPTLMRELNPYDNGAKLGLETFMRILGATRNFEPLKLLVEEMGYRLVRNQYEMAEEARLQAVL